MSLKRKMKDKAEDFCGQFRLLDSKAKQRHFDSCMFRFQINNQKSASESCKQQRVGSASSQ